MVTQKMPSDPFQSFRNIFKFIAVAIISAYIAYHYANMHPSIPPTNKELPVLTVAGIIHICPDNKIALIERGKNPKGIGMFGGHVEAKESPEEAFKRELKEELNISEIANLRLVGVHGDYGRDPRQHSVEITYTCLTSQIPKAGSDAKSVTLYSVNQIEKKLKTNPEDFAFDHAHILKHYIDQNLNLNPCPVITESKKTDSE